MAGHLNPRIAAEHSANDGVHLTVDDLLRAAEATKDLDDLTVTEAGWR